MLLLFVGIVVLIAIFTRPPDPGASEKAVRIYLGGIVSQREVQELAARGLKVPDVQMAGRWEGELKAVHETPFTSVATRCSWLSPIVLRRRCVVRIEMPAGALDRVVASGAHRAPADGDLATTVRYFRLKQTMFFPPSVLWEASPLSWHLHL